MMPTIHPKAWAVGLPTFPRFVMFMHGVNHFYFMPHLAGVLEVHDLLHGHEGFISTSLVMIQTEVPPGTMNPPKLFTLRMDFAGMETRFSLLTGINGREVWASNPLFYNKGVAGALANFHLWLDFEGLELVD